MNKDEQKAKVEIDPDYIYCPSSENSLTKFLAKHPDGVNDEKAAQVLMVPVDKLKKYYDEAIKLIREDMGLDEERE